MQMHIELADAPHRVDVHTGFIRRRCRNPRCGAKLKRETDNPRNAFCCRGCFEQHYRKLCLVCERPLRRQSGGTAGRPTQFCSPKCKFTFRRHSERFLGVWANVPAAQRNTPRSAHKSGLKMRAKGRPTWRVRAGPVANLAAVNLVVPLDPQTAARIRRANERVGMDVSEIATPAWPEILVGRTDYEHELLHQGRQLGPKQEVVQ